jgi:hypothetical protein
MDPFGEIAFTDGRQFYYGDLYTPDAVRAILARFGTRPAGEPAQSAAAVPFNFVMEILRGAGDHLGRVMAEHPYCDHVHVVKAYGDVWRSMHGYVPEQVAEPVIPLDKAIDTVAFHGGSVEIEAALRRLSAEPSQSSSAGEAEEQLQRVKDAYLALSDDHTNYGRNHERTMGSRVAFYMTLDKLAALSRQAPAAPAEAWTDDQMIRFGGYIVSTSLNERGMSYAERLEIFREHERARGNSTPPTTTEPAQQDMKPVPCDPLDALMFGANVAEHLLKIGRAIGFGRAQQILGEQWDALHDCAPRGSMGVTVGKCIPPKLWNKRSQDAYQRGWNECLKAVADATDPPPTEKQAPAITREFTNELGNRIKITIEGPTSTSENVLTPMEGERLRRALNERAEPAQQDTARLDYLQQRGATVELLPSLRFRIGGLHAAVNQDIRAAIDIARNAKGA